MTVEGLARILETVRCRRGFELSTALLYRGIMFQTYEGILPKPFCEHLIRRFDAAAEKDRSHEMFDQLELTPAEDWSQETAVILETVKRATADYAHYYDPHNMMPTQRRIETCRIKRYEPHKHRFPLHADAANYQSCTRYLAFLFYLNDSEAGTHFYGARGTEGWRVDATQGTLLIFPPMWMFPHEGLMPTTHPKYILSTYFHFAPPPAHS